MKKRHRAEQIVAKLRQSLVEHVVTTHNAW